MCAVASIQPEHAAEIAVMDSCCHIDAFGGFMSQVYGLIRWCLSSGLVLPTPRAPHRACCETPRRKPTLLYSFTVAPVTQYVSSPASLCIAVNALLYHHLSVFSAEHPCSAWFLGSRAPARCKNERWFFVTKAAKGADLDSDSMLPALNASVASCTGRRRLLCRRGSLE